MKKLLWSEMALIAVAVLLASCQLPSGKGLDGANDHTAPTVASTIPADGSIGAAINANVVAIYSKAMDSGSITSASFSLHRGATIVTGTLYTVGAATVFRPDGGLTAYSSYSVTITPDAKDLVGNALLSAKTWTFMTGPGADTTAPTVISVTPADQAVGVALTTSLTLNFSESMCPLSINSSNFTLWHGTTPLTGLITNMGTSTTFAPAERLLAGTTYSLTITAGPQDLSGNKLAAPQTWSFTTAGS